MAYKIKLLPVVQKNLSEAKDWYFNQGGDLLAGDFKREVNKEVDYIARFPEHYQIKYKNVRQALVNRFPYLILYRLQEETVMLLSSDFSTLAEIHALQKQEDEIAKEDLLFQLSPIS